MAKNLGVRIFVLYALGCNKHTARKAQSPKSHADELFKEKFSALLEHVDEADELGYRLLWQGEPEDL